MKIQYVVSASLAGVALFALVGLSLAVGVFAGKTSQHADERSKQAKQIAQQTAQIVADFNKSPFEANSDTLDWIQIDNGPRFKPTIHAVVVHQCTLVGLGRSAYVTEDFDAFVTKNYKWSAGGGLTVSPGAEHFTVKGNPNEMRPVFRIPSNLPHYRYIIYNVTIQDTSRPAPALPLQVIVFYIIDNEQPLPAPGQPVPAGPGPHDHDDRDECPALTVPSAPS